MEDYVQDLSRHLLASFGMEKRIEVKTSIQIPLLDVDSAIPLGLIINELVTNALKYAFPKGRKGAIKVNLWIDDKQELCLSVSDNGKGPVEKFKLKHSTSFGTDLVKILSKKLKGHIQISTDTGYRTFIRFRRYEISKYAVS